MDNQDRPLLIDFFCGAGGCSVGYSSAGFDVVGCDIKPQKRYPFDFLQMDALEALRRLIAGESLQFGERWIALDCVAAIHASPPCQKFTKSSLQWRKNGRNYPDLIDGTRQLLIATKRPYIIENVLGAPLDNPTMLNGAKFGMSVARKRLFETSFLMPFELLPPDRPAVKMGRPVKVGDVIQPVGNFSGVNYARQEMRIDWMTRDELAQAIPPAYTEYIGKILLTASAELHMQPTKTANS